MNARHLLLPLAAALLAACSATGNPREGGLFGWRESLARERLDERRASLDRANAELARERRENAWIAGTLRTVSRDETAAAHSRDRAMGELSNREAAVAAKAARLEAESPTPASASRARRLREEVEAIRRDRGLAPEARARRLRELEIIIDEALARSSR